MVTWTFFKNRRKLDTEKWLENLGLGRDDYNDFCAVLVSLGVEPPDKATFHSYFPKPKPKPKPKPRSTRKTKTGKKKPEVEKVETAPKSASPKVEAQDES